MDELLDITLFVASVFERLEIPYLVGGSLASSMHGIPRATQDVDLVAGLRSSHVPAFVTALKPTFYLDEDTIVEAVEQRTSFNVIHLATLFKLDVFVSKDDLASREQMRRRLRIAIGDGPGQALMVASPEDVVAQKLYWFALGDEVSERQWGDAVGVLKVADDSLDMQYLRRIAKLLGVESLLNRAIDEL